MRCAGTCLLARRRDLLWQIFTLRLILAQTSNFHTVLGTAFTCSERQRDHQDVLVLPFPKCCVRGGFLLQYRSFLDAGTVRLLLPRLSLRGCSATFFVFVFGCWNLDTSFF